MKGCVYVDNQVNKSGFLIDYFTFSTKNYTLQGVLDLIGLNKPNIWEECRGKYLYEDGLYFESIKILFNGKTKDMEGSITCEMTGQGCRAFEEWGNGDFSSLFQEVNFGNINCTRIDPTFDEREEKLNLQTLIQDTLTEDIEGNFKNLVTDFKSASVNINRPKSKGDTLYLGSKQSECYYRIYDKAKERGFQDLHWIRLENQLRKDYAQNFVTATEREYNGDWTRLYLELLKKKVRYVEESQDRNDSNNRRWDTKDYWAEFLKDVEKAKPFIKPGMKYNKERLMKYVDLQAGNSVLTAMEILGGPQNLEAHLKEERQKQGKDMPEKYKYILKQEKLISEGLIKEPETNYSLDLIKSLPKYGDTPKDTLLKNLIK